MNTKSEIIPSTKEMWEAWQEEDYWREMGEEELDEKENDKNYEL